MSAASPISGSGTTAARGRLDVARFEELTAALGATDDVARARLIGVDRTSIWRYRTGKFGPRLEVAMRIAERLGTTVDDLFPRRAA